MADAPMPWDGGWGRLVGAPERLSGGFLNRVWRAPTATGTVIVKHAPPYVASAPDIPLDPARAAHEARALRRLAGGFAGVRVPRLLHVDPGRATLVMEDLGPLPDLAASLAVADVERLGAFIAALHRTEAPEMANPGVQRTRQAVQYAAARGWLAGRPEANAVGDALEALGERFCGPGRAWVMGDLWPPSVRVGAGGAVAVIDWELTHWGDPAQDLGHLLAHLWRLGADGRAAWSAVLRGYGPVDPETRLSSVQHAGAELLMRSLGPFRERPPDAAAVAAGIDAAVRGALAGWW